MYIHQKNLFFGSINMYFELPHGDSTMQLAGYIGRIIPIPNWDWSEVSHWLASHEIPMKCPWNPIYIYIHIGWLLPWNPNMFPMYFPCFFSQNHVFFFHQDAEIAGGFSMLRASPGASVWPCASGGTSIMALRLGWGENSHGAMGGKLGKPFKTPWFAWKLCCFHVFHIFVDVFLIFFVCLQERKH